MATHREIQDLKTQWIEDPSWDIEDTEGFEKHRDELISWRKHIEAQNFREHWKKIREKARNLDCSNLTAGYILELEERLDRLEENLKTHGHSSLMEQ